MSHTVRDLKWDDDGDLAIDDTGDFDMATPKETVIQDVEFRIRSEFDDFGPDPMLAAGLSRFKGQPNTRATGDAVKEAVYYALTKDGRFPKSGIFVDVVPLSRHSLTIFIFIQDYIEDTINDPNPYDYFYIALTFNLDIGRITRITDVKE